MSWREVHAAQKWAGLGALLGELLADRGTGRLHPYTGTSGLGLQAAAVKGKQRAVPRAVLVTSSTVRV